MLALHSLVLNRIQINFGVKPKFSSMVSIFVLILTKYHQSLVLSVSTLYLLVYSPSVRD